MELAKVFGTVGQLGLTQNLATGCSLVSCLGIELAHESGSALDGRISAILGVESEGADTPAKGSIFGKQNGHLPARRASVAVPSSGRW